NSPARVRTILRAAVFSLDDPPDADIYALGPILHDWPEEKILLLLRRIADRLPAGGGVLLAEKLIAEDRSGPIGAHMQNLSMLICTEGKERSLSEYAALLSEAGFSRIEGKRTGSYLDAVLAVKGS